MLYIIGNELKKVEKSRFSERIFPKILAFHIDKRGTMGYDGSGPEFPAKHDIYF